MNEYKHNQKNAPNKKNSPCAVEDLHGTVASDVGGGGGGGEQQQGSNEASRRHKP